jgi:hypothetical protein
MSRGSAFVRPALVLTVWVIVSGTLVGATVYFHSGLEEHQELTSAKTPDQLADRIDGLLASRGRSDLDRMISAPDRTTAIAAGWERVRRTMPEAD